MNLEHDDEQLRALLPWYLNNRLEATERAEVERWLAASEQARAALAELEALAPAVRAAEQQFNAAALPPSDLGWARLQRSLAAEKPRRDWWKPGLAVAAALVLALQLNILLRPAQPTQWWEPQGREQLPVLGGYRVQLRFAEQARWTQIQQLLQEVDGVIVDGPSALGLIQVQIPPNSRFANAQALLDWLRQQPQVQHVALLGGTTP